MLKFEFTLSLDRLRGTIWRFGPAADPPELVPHRLRFAPGGKIELYFHPNERGWAVREGRLCILREDGAVMWESSNITIADGALNITLRSPILPEMVFALREVLPDYAQRATESAALSPARFLFPDDLQVTPTKLRKVLMIGSCLTLTYLGFLRKAYPAVIFDYVAFNNASVLPEAPPSAPAEYDFQYVQIPMRSVLTDRVVDAAQRNDPEQVGAILRDAYAMIDVMLEATLVYARQHGVPAFIANFFVPQTNVTASMDRRGSLHDLAEIIRALNLYLADAVRRQPNVFLCDTEALAASFGKRLFLDDVISFSSHGAILKQEEYDLRPHARIEPVPEMHQFYETRQSDFFRAIFEQAAASYRTLRQIDQVKAVIFDLDHTLWRGQIAEDYRPGAERPPHSEWQVGLWDAIQQLRARGILVAICSKNDFKTVRQNWLHVVQPLFVKLEDFSSVKINWLPKEENIRAILAEFSLTPKSVVFVDDNPVEREAVRAALPGIRVLGANPYLTRRILLWSPETQVAHLTAESVGRAEAIRGQIVREESRATVSRAEFLATLKCEVMFIALQDTGRPEFARVLELTNKTNQFNTTGKRWTLAEVQNFLRNGGEVFGFSVRDRFTDYGIVGAVYLQGARIVQMIMSCRVLGMEVEHAAVARAVACIRARIAGPVDAELVETADNGPCRETYSRVGFIEQLGPGGASRLFRLGAEVGVEAPSHITLKETVLF